MKDKKREIRLLAIKPSKDSIVYYYNMTHKLLILFTALMLTAAPAQGLAMVIGAEDPAMTAEGGQVKGRVLDKNANTPMEYVNVRVMTKDSTLVGGTVSDATGSFIVSGLKNGDYFLELSSIGYKTLTREFSITSSDQQKTYALLYMNEDSHMLQGVTVTGIKSAMKLEVDRKTYDVSQLVTNTGSSASETLDNIPSIEVDQDGNISLRGNSSVEIWINGKASGLNSDNRAQILEQLPAESIERVEVIDNPSAKYSAEGSAGIINIILKKDLKPGYYGSVQAGGDTRGGANTSFNFNYNSKLIDFNANVGYRHRENEGKAQSHQVFTNTNTYQNYNGRNTDMGNNLFTRAGVTLHATKKDDVSLSGMMMHGLRKEWGNTPYHYGTLGAAQDSRIMTRHTKDRGSMDMLYGEFNYRHYFNDRHYLDFVVDYNRWKSDNDNWYQDSTTYISPEEPTDYAYQYRPMHINNHRWEVKLDYENAITDNFKIQAGYQGSFSHENTPQESYNDSLTWDGSGNLVEDYLYYNRFIYDMDVHAGYATATMKFGKLGFMAGLRGEYWKVDTRSDNYVDPDGIGQWTMQQSKFKKDYFQLFPSVFISYELTPTQQLQLNYTRRLRRPWGGQLNSFRDTRDATTVRYGNPELTPEYSNSFQLNYLKTWTQHSLMLSAYYRPTTDVMQGISYQNQEDGRIYSTTMNVTKSQSSGMEMVLKNRFFKILDLTTTASAYHYKLDGFDFLLDGNEVSGPSEHRFTWEARMNAQLMLPYDITLQLGGRYHSRQTITQGYRKANYRMDFGLRKNFFNKALTLSINCRDLLNSREWKTHTSDATFVRDQLNRRGGRRFNFTVTWNFGNNRAKKKPQHDQSDSDDDSGMSGSGYDM